MNPFFLAMIVHLPFLQEPQAIDLPGLVVQLVALAGFGGLIALLINVGKHFGIVHDGTSQSWSLGLNAVGLVVLVVLRIFAPQLDVSAGDQQVAQAVQAFTILFGLFTQLAGAKGANALVRGTPVIGKTFSGEPRMVPGGDVSPTPDK